MLEGDKNCGAIFHESQETKAKKQNKIFQTKKQAWDTDILKDGQRKRILQRRLKKNIVRGRKVCYHRNPGKMVLKTNVI